MENVVVSNSMIFLCQHVSVVKGGDYMPLPDSFIQELKMRADIVDVVSDYVHFNRSGRNLVCLCPFHSEKTPSFRIYPETGSFYCFGCGAGGEVITFIRKIENLDYIEAVKLLADRVGLPMPENSYDDGIAKLRTRIFEANREAARFFYAQLYSEVGKSALNYLRNRGLSEHTIKHFGLGYSPNNRYALVDYLKSKGFNDHEIVSANLAYQNKNGKISDRFYDRVMFPIIDLRGNVIAFGGRIMGDAKPKYLNTSDTLVFKKSDNIFSLNFAKNSDKKHLILAEGYMDVIALHQAGFTEAVATLGTALTSEQAMLMKRYVDELVVCYDADEAGQKAAQRAIGLLRQAGINIKILTVPDGKDPDEFIKKHGENGAARFKQLLENSGNDVEYRLQKIKQTCDMNSPSDRVKYLTEAAKLLATLDSKIEQEVYALKLSEEVNVQKEIVIQQVNKLSRRKNNEYQKRQFREIQDNMSARSDKINPQKSGKLRAAKAEEAIIAYLVYNPDMVRIITEMLPPEKIITDFNRRVYVCITTRLLNGLGAMPIDIASEFSPDENASIAAMLAIYQREAATIEAAEEYIKTILSENDKLNMSNNEKTKQEDILEYMKKLKEIKK
ncbi:MAG: DNA primase [Bacillota bacterium]|nr:DNA primase [Bacillota bacterium]